MESPGKVATLRDVARLAEVSVRTVSNVVNGSVPVSAPTRERVQRAVEQLDYRPNVAAQRLRSGRSHVLGLAIPDVTVPYFREFADAVLSAAGRRGFAVLVEQTHGEVDRERSIVVNPRLRHVDGIVLAAVSIVEEDVATFAGTRPLVLAGTPLTSELVDSVGTDDFAAGQAIARHLVAGGRRRPAAIVPTQSRWPAEHDRRYAGYLAGLRELGVDGDARFDTHTPTSALDAGDAAVRGLFERAPDTDAVFALGDALALGALHGLRGLGREVPADVAVVGFGNVELGAYSNPTLTTVEPGREATAEHAVALLVEGASSAPQRHTVRYTLIERESSGRIT